VVKVHGYRPTGPGFDFQRYQIFWEVRVVCLERSPVSLSRTRVTEFSFSFLFQDDIKMNST
jgi:hypothetical protein